MLPAALVSRRPALFSPIDAEASNDHGGDVDASMTASGGSDTGVLAFTPASQPGDHRCGPRAGSLDGQTIPATDMRTFSRPGRATDGVLPRGYVRRRRLDFRAYEQRLRRRRPGQPAAAMPEQEQVSWPF